MNGYDDDNGGWGNHDEDELRVRRKMFKGPGSALRASSRTNPRNLPCPTCEAPNRLTPKDRALGYQCDECADRAEGGGW